MGFLLSPKVEIKEIDLTNIIPGVATTDAAYARLFTWGPLQERSLVSSEANKDGKSLVDRFGPPNGDTYEHFFQASNFLSYSNKLRLVRVAHEVQAVTVLVNKLTTTVGSPIVTIAHTTHGLQTGQYIRISGVSATFDGLTAATLNGKHLITVTTANSYTITVASNATAGVSSGGGTLNVGSEDVALNATSDKYTGLGVAGQGVLVRNANHYSLSYETGGGDVGLWAAKYPGVAGNSLKVSICSSASAYSKVLTGTLTSVGTAVTGSGTAFTTQVVVGSILVHPTTGEERKVASIGSTTALVLSSAFSADISGATVTAKWEYYSEFGVAPATSAFALTRGCLNDEIHVIVIDEDGLFGGIRNQVLEKYSFLSLMGTAKTNQGEGNFYKSVINTKSQFIWWMDHLPAGTNWGSTLNDITFTPVIIPYTVSLNGGQDGNTSATNGDLQIGYDYFAQAEEVDVSLVISPPGNSVLTEYISQNICGLRKDCIVVSSTSKASVVDNNNLEVTAVKSFFNAVSASSYVVADSNWGYQYDRYNDVYRWVPCSAHVAGLMARVDTERDPWWSPAGLIYGHLKNVIKLAWNPNQAERDDLYLQGINPIMSIPGQGVVLFGDKTYLNRPSAFDRINVRRLFIVLEKAIATASKFILFSFNDEITRAQFRNLVEPFLREVKGRRGVIDYRVVCDETNNTGEVIDRNEFIGDIYIKPARSINYITLNFIAVRTGVEFSEVVGKF